ncbi:hypothetical protein B0H16DRAFT_1875903 [Mycena metata]|uniref:Uncharacterized protein n=1 Tax=Mycena metata TaxID=1033252 RepID=A0AAD7P314_9AGAR|nr:hypothetical protein B0H16DRAFT_1875903 [Mycena metata]
MRLNIILLRPRLRSMHLQIKTAFKTSPLPPPREQKARTVSSIPQDEHDAVLRSLPVLLVLILFNYTLAEVSGEEGNDHDGRRDLAVNQTALERRNIIVIVVRI